MREKLFRCVMRLYMHVYACCYVRVFSNVCVYTLHVYIQLLEYPFKLSVIQKDDMALNF